MRQQTCAMCAMYGSGKEGGLFVCVCVVVHLMMAWAGVRRR